MNLKKNILLFYFITFFESCLFYLPIWYLFLVNFMHFGTGDAIFSYTLIGLVSMIFEVHSGGWADRYGRKRVYIVGQILALFSLTFFLWAHEIYLFFISAIFSGIGYSMLSGNLEALIHDNLEEEGKGEQYDKIQANQYIIMYLGRSLSSLVAGYMYFYNEYLPYVATIIGLIIAMIFVLSLHSPKQELSHETSDYAHIKKALVFLYAKKNMLLVIAFAGVVFSGIGNIYWFTYQPYLEKIGIDVKYIGIVYFFISLFSAFGSYIIKKMLVGLNTFFMLKLMIFGLFISSLMFAFFDNYLGLLPIIIIQTMFGFVMILGNTYLIKASPKTHKSTILSIFSFSFSLGYFAFGTVAGYIAQIFSLKILYIILPIPIFLLLVSLIVLSRKIKV